jgi:transposase
VDGILYVVRTGCAWRYLSADFPRWQAEYWYFKHWAQAKVTEVMLVALREQAPVQHGRNLQPSAGSSTRKASRTRAPSDATAVVTTPARRSTAGGGSSSPTLRSHDPLGRDQRHDQPHRPRRTRYTATTLALARRIMTAVPSTRQEERPVSPGDPLTKIFFT